MRLQETDCCHLNEICFLSLKNWETDCKSLNFTNCNTSASSEMQPFTALCVFQLYISWNTQTYIKDFVSLLHMHTQNHLNLNKLNTNCLGRNILKCLKRNLDSMPNILYVIRNFSKVL